MVGGVCDRPLQGGPAVLVVLSLWLFPGPAVLTLQAGRRWVLSSLSPSVCGGRAGRVHLTQLFLQVVTRGCETVELTLRRNGLGQLGFHVNFEGIVADVEPFGFAWKAGLRQGSRLVEICKVAVATLTHEQMIDLLRTSVTVKVVIIQPHDDGSPRR